MPVSYIWPLQTNAIFQLTTPISHRIAGINNTSAVRTIWVTVYASNFKTEATFGCETTHLKPPLVWCCLKHDIHWTCCERTTETASAAPSSFLNHWTSQPQKTKRHGLKVDGASFRTWQCYRRLTANFRNAVAPCMDFSVHVPNGSLMIALQRTSNLRINRSISHGSEYCLCIRVEAYFQGWCNPNHDFGIWSA